ncbi:hypothetical protein ASF86_05325 [Acinetobacter sp. Leaf130]|nr:hypothetical protein ASF86_05325 [Acinetobacter sp. Leaf130]
MDVQSQLLFIGSSAKTLELWWQNGRGFADWLRHPAHPRVSLSRPTATGGNEELTHKTIPQKK